MPLQNISVINKTCHRDRIARLTAPCQSHKKLNVKLFANANVNANAEGSTIALPGLRPGELKMAKVALDHRKVLFRDHLLCQKWYL